jgi:hypothetical protein
MGPESAKRVPGQQLVDVTTRPTGRAKQAVDYGRRGSGYVFGAFQPATGAALTWTAERRTTATFVAFLELAQTWIDPGVQRVYAILEHRFAHRATAVLLFALAHPRWEVVFPPKYAAYVHLIEPWCTILRSLALKGQRLADVATDLRRRGTGDGLLECAHASLHLGPPTPPPTMPSARHCPGTLSRMNLADAPLSNYLRTAAGR